MRGWVRGRMDEGMGWMRGWDGEGMVLARGGMPGPPSVIVPLHRCVGSSHVGVVACCCCRLVSSSVHVLVTSLLCVFVVRVCRVCCVVALSCHCCVPSWSCCCCCVVSSLARVLATSLSRVVCIVLSCYRVVVVCHRVRGVMVASLHGVVCYSKRRQRTMLSFIVWLPHQ